MIIIIINYVLHPTPRALFSASVIAVSHRRACEILQQRRQLIPRRPLRVLHLPEPRVLPIIHLPEPRILPLALPVIALLVPRVVAAAADVVVAGGGGGGVVGRELVLGLMRGSDVGEGTAVPAVGIDEVGVGVGAVHGPGGVVVRHGGLLGRVECAEIVSLSCLLLRVEYPRTVLACPLLQIHALVSELIV